MNISQRRAAPWTLTLTAAIGLTAGCAGPDVPRWARRVLDCSELEEPTAAMLDAIDRGEPPILDTDLAPGQSRAVFSIANAEGTRWSLTPLDSPTEIRHQSGSNLGPRWTVQVNIQCNALAGMAFSFDRHPDAVWPLVEGIFDVKAVGVDVVDFEQSTLVYEGRPHSMEGVVRVTTATAASVSGYFDGRASGPILSHFYEHDMETDFTFVGAAFRELGLR